MASQAKVTKAVRNRKKLKVRVSRAKRVKPIVADRTEIFQALEKALRPVG